MSLILDENSANFQIRAYEPGQIQINDKIMDHSIIISAKKLIDDWQPQNISALKVHDLHIIKEMQPDILLIGTGARLIFPPLEVYGDLVNLGIGVEIMDTRAACRTYNALTSENRNVIAALIIS